MRVQVLRLLALSVMLVVTGCSDDEGAGDSAAPSAPTASTGSTTLTTPPATTEPPSRSMEDRSLAEAALQEAIGEVEGLTLDADQLACLSSRLMGDNEVPGALDRGLTFEALEPALQERVLRMAVACAPAPIAASVVDSVGPDLDDRSRRCLVERLSADTDLLVRSVQIALGTRASDAVSVPPAVLADVVALGSACEVALPE